MPTLHLVAAIRVRLLQHVSPNPADLEPVVELKPQLTAFVKIKLVLNKLHHIAALLDPRLKGNHDLMSPDDRQAALADLRQMVKDFEFEVPTTSNQGIKV